MPSAPSSHIKCCPKNQNHPLYWAALTLLLILGGLLLRMYRLTSRSLWLDEALCVKIAAITNFNDMWSSITQDIHPPFFYVLLHFWIRLFNNLDFFVRLFAVVWGCIGLYGIYFLCRYGLKWNRKHSNLAMLFSIILPIHIYYSQEVRPYGMLFALACFSLTFLFRAHLTSGMKYYILFGLFQALMFYVHHTAIIYCFFINGLYFATILFYGQIHVKRLKGISLAGMISVLLYLPWLPHLLIQFENPVIFKGFWYWVPQPTAIEFFKMIAKLISVWRLSLPFHIPEVLYLLLTFPILILLFLGQVYAWRHRLTSESILGLAIVGYPLFILALSYLILPVWLIRILVPATIGVPVIAVLALKIRSLPNRHFKFITAFVVISLLICLITSSNLLYSYRKEDWREAGKFVSQSASKNDSVIVYRDYYAVPLERYVESAVSIKAVHVPGDTSEEVLPKMVAERIVSLSKDSKRLYLVLAMSNVPTNILLGLMMKTHRLCKRKAFYGGIEVLEFQRTSKV